MVNCHQPGVLLRHLNLEVLRTALGQEYGDIAYASVGESKQEQVRTALARKRG
jgi:hypothetical protein